MRTVFWKRIPLWAYPLLLVLCLCGFAPPTAAAEKKTRRGAKTDQAAAAPDYRYDEEEEAEGSDPFIAKDGKGGTAASVTADKYMSGAEEGQQQKFEPFAGNGDPDEEAPRRRGLRFWRRNRAADEEQPEERAVADGSVSSENDGSSGDPEPAVAIGTTGRPATRTQVEPSAPPMPTRMGLDDGPGLEPWRVPPPAPPTRAEVEDYRVRLESRLLERYNNLPDHAGNVAKVTVVLSKPLIESMDGSRIRAEFDQLVYDPWGKRIPQLEEEYYVVVFGAGGARQVRSDPSIRVGLDLEKTYSEKAPLAADPFRNIQESDAFRPAPTIKMPEWWRPDYPELE